MLTSLAEGPTINDRYQILRLIGGGGMGAVYEALDLRLRNVVAVKEMTVDGPGAAAQFEREAGLLASLRHPGLPVVIDHFGEGTGRFLVMQFIDGEDLSSVLTRRGAPCALEDVIAWGIALLEILIYLHSQSPPIVHRDIKPSNVRRTPAGAIVLLDFGLAKGHLQLSDSTTRVDQSVFGFTPTYAPLEQINGLGTTPQSDLYALGATLYHLVTGRVPITARDRAEARAGGRDDPLPRADRLNPAVTIALASWLDRALALDVRDRFASAQEMRRTLDDVGVPAPAAKKPPSSSERRVDAAMPGQVQVGRPADLLVQVRFADSPRLGLEDWPTKTRPDAIEQAAEQVHVVHARDPRSGDPIPTRLRVKLVSPDFVIYGDAERLVDVPAADYSKRLAFLLSPRWAGQCRVNVEVYGPDAVFLGGIAMETEAVAAPATIADRQIANLVLLVVARDAAPPLLLQRRAAAGEAAAKEVRRPRAPAAALPPSVSEAPRAPLAVGLHSSLRRAASALAIFAVVVVATFLWPATRRAKESKVLPIQTAASDALRDPAAVRSPSPSSAEAIRVSPMPRAARPDSPRPFANRSAPSGDIAAATPVTAEVHARTEIANLVQQYCAAYATKNSRILESLYPSLSRATLSADFATALRCTTDAPRFERLSPGSNGSASLQFHMVKKGHGNANATATTLVQVTMVVSRPDFTKPWRIDRVRRDEVQGSGK